jgi:hypothetical protein
VPRLLDLAFGFFAWALHFLAVYSAAALACALGLAGASPGSRVAFLTALALATVGAAAVVLWHALRRYRQQRDLPEQRFLMSVTIGGDAVAFAAMAWQLFPILLVPACA